MALISESVFRNRAGSFFDAEIACTGALPGTVRHYASTILILKSEEYVLPVHPDRKATVKFGIQILVKIDGISTMLSIPACTLLSSVLTIYHPISSNLQPINIWIL